MTIDINELREAVQTFGSQAINEDDLNELLDRLEAAESECLEQARLNGMGSEREAALMAKLEAAEKEREALRNEIACIKEVEFPRKAQAVADAWKGKCERLEAERDALRAKIEVMEKQEPVAFGLYSGWALKATYLKEHEACEQRDRRQLTADLAGSLEAYRAVPLYALPGAKGEEK